MPRLNNVGTARADYTIAEYFSSASFPLLPVPLARPIMPCLLSFSPCVPRFPASLSLSFSLVTKKF